MGCMHNCVLLLLRFFPLCIDYTFLATANWRKKNSNVCTQCGKYNIGNAIATLVLSNCCVYTISKRLQGNNNKHRRHRVKKQTNIQKETSKNSHCIHTIYYLLCHTERHCVLQLVCDCMYVVLALFHCFFPSHFAILPLFEQNWMCVLLQWLYGGFGHCVKPKAKHTAHKNA